VTPLFVLDTFIRVKTVLDTFIRFRVKTVLDTFIRFTFIRLTPLFVHLYSF